MAERKGKKFINNPQDCVHESLLGFVLTHPQLRLLDGYNTVIRSDVGELIKSGKVCLVTGGGSGHEPSHIGYIGKGLLTASVCGDVFASPPASAVLAAIKACASPAGVLLIVTNYTGDRLNFGKAAELAKHEGINVEMVIVGEDCALTSKDKSAGRRGLCGTMFIHKIVGALAESGCNIKEIKEHAMKAASEMGTISISLSPCSVPGQAPTFQVAEDEAEFGLGIHGEPGIKKIKMKPAKELVKEMVDHIEKSGYIAQVAGSSLAVFVNGLGGTSQLELSLVTGELFKAIETRGGTISRLYVGLFMTSLEMAGISITLLHADKERLNLLDMETSASAWPKQGKTGKFSEIWMPIHKESSSVSLSKHISEEPNEMGCLLLQSAQSVCDILISKEETLNAFDRNAGDGDCGSTFSRGAKALRSQLGTENRPEMPINYPDEFFLKVGNVMERSMGGSSGALLSLFFTAGSTPLKDGGSADTFVRALKQGTDAMAKYGGAEAGDRTMLDALIPVVKILSKELSEGNRDPCKLSKIASKVAMDGATSTVKMQARAGRASYVSSAHFTDPDPGAMAVAYIAQAVSQVLRKE